MAIEDLELDALIKAGIYRNRTEAIAAAMQALFVARPQLKVEAALQLYQDSEVTLGRAAEIADMTRWEFETLLTDRGINRIVYYDPTETLEFPAGQHHRQKQNADRDRSPNV